MTQNHAIGAAEYVHGQFGLGTNQGGMREANERVVLTVLRRNPSITKAEIARTTGLSAQTVARLVGALEQDGLVLRGAPNRGRIGQPSIPLSLDPDGAVFFGLKVGRRSAEMIAIDFLGKILDREQLLYGYPDFDEVLSFATSAQTTIQDRLPPKLQSRVSGLGVAMPFHLWNWARHIGVDASKMRDWQHRDLGAEIAVGTSIPVFLQNDATAACSAEIVFGNAPFSRNMLSFYIAFFVGGGLVLNNTLYLGATGNAAGLGPFTVADREGRARNLIDLASLSDLEKRLANAGWDTQKMWTDSAEWGFPADIVGSWRDECVHGIASAIKSAQALLDLDTVLIDGWLPRDLLARITTGVEVEFEQLDREGIATPTILCGTIGKDARTVGAASLPLSHRYLNI
jgi:predicted NBD/HSP70 family sugar kinase